MTDTHGQQHEAEQPTPRPFGFIVKRMPGARFEPIAVEDDQPEGDDHG